MKLKRLIAGFCAMAVVFASAICRAEASNNSGTTITLTKTETVSCGSVAAAGQYNPVIDVSVGSGNGAVAVNVLKNSEVVWKQLVSEGESGKIDIIINVDNGDNISFTMTPETGKTPEVVYSYAEGSIYRPVTGGKNPQGYSYAVKSEKRLSQYIDEAEYGNVYAMYNYQRIPMSKGSSAWSVNPLTEFETGTYGDLNNRGEAVVTLSTTTARLGNFGGTPNIDIPVTEAGLIKISGNVPGIVLTKTDSDGNEEYVNRGIVTNIYKNGEKLWSSRVGEYASSRFDEGYQNSYFDEEIDVVTKVEVDDVITFSFDSWHSAFNGGATMNIEDVKLAYIDGDPMGASAKWLFKNSDVYDAEKGIVYQKGEPKKIKMLAEDGEAYIAADEIGTNVSFDRIPLKEETARETFDYPDSGTGLKGTYSPFYISTPIGQVKDHSIAYIGGSSSAVAQFIMNGETFAAASEPLSDGLVTFEFRCKGNTGGDVMVKFGRGEGTNSWWEDGIAKIGFNLNYDFGCTPSGGTKVKPTYTYADGWYRCKVEVDVANKMAYMSVNGTKTAGLSLEGMELSDLFRIQLRKGMTAGQDFYVDDARINYTEDAADQNIWVRSLMQDGNKYYNLADLIVANGKSAAAYDGRFVIAFDGLNSQVSYAELSQISAILCDDAILTKYGTKVDFSNLGDVLRVDVSLLNTAVDKKTAKVILAGYKDNVLVNAKSVPYEILKDDTAVLEFCQFDNTLQYDRIGVFVWGTGEQSMQPYTEYGYINKQQ